MWKERPIHAGPHQCIRNKFLSDNCSRSSKPFLAEPKNIFQCFFLSLAFYFKAVLQLLRQLSSICLSLSSNSPSVVHQLFANFHPTICWLYSKGVPSSNVLTADVPYTPAVRHLSTSCSLGVRQLSINHSPASAQLLAASPSTE